MGTFALVVIVLIMLAVGFAFDDFTRNGGNKA